MMEEIKKAQKPFNSKLARLVSQQENTS